MVVVNIARNEVLPQIFLRLRKAKILLRFVRRLKRLINPKKLLGETSYREQLWFERFVQETYTGAGEIVDLGCWLGSTTIPLAKGLEKNTRPSTSNRVIHAYDLFIWGPRYENAVIGTELEGKYRPNESILEEFEKRTVKWSDHIEVYAGDLCQIGWPSSSKIEVLLIDAMKSWKLCNSIVINFYPFLMVGSSYVIYQDFSHYFTPWIHLLNYHFRHYFAFFKDVKASGSTVFKLIKSIPEEDLNNFYSFDYFSPEEINSAFDYSMSLVDKSNRANVAAAKVMCFIHQNQIGRALVVLKEFLTQGLPLRSDLSIVKEIIKKIRMSKPNLR